MDPRIPGCPLLAVGLLLVGAACAAPAPPIAVETPFGVVRAESEEKADEVAGLLTRLTPRLRALLPGTQEREVDVWVQDVLRSTRHGSRAKGVKGFTLLSGEFQPKRIHLLETGELAWYLSHELVHALADESWRPLPGLLEEGLGDVVAEALNPEFAGRIRAHRLFTASGFSGGMTFRLVYRRPSEGRWRRAWVEAPMRLQVMEEYSCVDLTEVLGLSRKELRKRWKELPEPFYGLAYLIVSRIVERHGFEGLYGLCDEARREGLALVPAERVLEAAELDADRFDGELLASLFGRDEMHQLLLMHPEMFGNTVIDFFRANHSGLTTRELLYRVNPCLRVPDGSLLRLRSVWPVREQIVEAW